MIFFIWAAISEPKISVQWAGSGGGKVRLNRSGEEDWSEEQDGEQAPNGPPYPPPPAPAGGEEDTGDRWGLFVDDFYGVGIYTPVRFRSARQQHPPTLAGRGMSIETPAPEEGSI